MSEKRPWGLLCFMYCRFLGRGNAEQQVSNDAYGKTITCSIPLLVWDPLNKLNLVRPPYFYVWTLFWPNRKMTMLGMLFYYQHVTDQSKISVSAYFSLYNIRVQVILELLFVDSLIKPNEMNRFVKVVQRGALASRVTLAQHIGFQFVYSVMFVSCTAFWTWLHSLLGGTSKPSSLKKTCVWKVANCSVRAPFFFLDNTVGFDVASLG